VGERRERWVTDEKCQRQEGWASDERRVTDEKRQHRNCGRVQARNRGERQEGWACDEKGGLVNRKIASSKAGQLSDEGGKHANRLYLYHPVQ